MKFRQVKKNRSSNRSLDSKERSSVLSPIRLSPFLPQTISELLPDAPEETTNTVFVALGPMLIESLSNGENLIEAANKVGLNPTDAARLLATPEFIRYIEAYLSIGDLTDKSARLRLSRAILASLVANGRIANSKRDALDYLEHIRRETEVSKRGGSLVAVQINNGPPRPY